MKKLSKQHILIVILGALLIPLLIYWYAGASAVGEAAVLHAAGVNSYDESEFHDGIQPLKKAFALREEHLGSVHVDTIDSARYLITCMDNNGDEIEASDFTEGYLKRIEALEGKDSIQYANIEAMLGTIKADLGELDEAVELLRHAEKIIVSEHGKADEASFLAMHNLNYALARAGRVDEAVEREAELLKLRIAARGMEHRETAKSLTNLAFALSKQGNHQRALELHEQSLGIRKKVFGPNHPETYVEMVNLAVSYEREGRVEEAVRLSRAGYEFFLGFYGESHPDVSWSALNLFRIMPEAPEYTEERERLRLRHQLD